MAGKKSVMRLKKLIVKLKICINLLHRVMPLSIDQVGSSSTTLVPAGHFTVVAGKGPDDDEDDRRFAVELKYLKSPALLKLLKEAEDEYGFNQQGALVLPCTPKDLKKVLQGNVPKTSSSCVRQDSGRENKIIEEKYLRE